MAQPVDTGTTDPTEEQTSTGSAGTDWAALKAQYEAESAAYTAAKSASEARLAAFKAQQEADVARLGTVQGQSTITGAVEGPAEGAKGEAMLLGARATELAARDIAARLMPTVNARYVGREILVLADVG